MHDMCQAGRARLPSVASLGHDRVRRSVLAAMPFVTGRCARASQRYTARDGAGPCSVSARPTRDPLADARSAERWLAIVSGQRSARRCTARCWPSSAASPSATRGARRSASRPCSSSTHSARPLRAALTAQYIEHANRSSKIEHQLWSALFDLTQAFLLAYQAFAREVSRARAQREVAAAAARARVPADRAPRPRRARPPVPLRAVDSRQVGRAARAVLARLLAPDRARAARARHAAASTTRSSTSTCVVLLLQLMNAGNLTPRHLEWVCRASSTNGARRCASRSSRRR